MAKKLTDLGVLSKKVDDKEWDSPEDFYEYLGNLGLEEEIRTSYNDLETGLESFGSYMNKNEIKNLVSEKLEETDGTFFAREEVLEGKKNFKHYFSVDIGHLRTYQLGSETLSVPRSELRFSYKQKKD